MIKLQSRKLTGVLILVLCTIISLWFVFFYADEEQQDWQMRDYTQKACTKIFSYYFQYQQFPTALKEASVNDIFKPTFYRSFSLVYKVIHNGQDFHLVSKVAGDFVVFLAPRWEYLDIKQKKADLACFAGLLARPEGYEGNDSLHPIYRSSIPPFDNPSEWPKLSEK